MAKRKKLKGETILVVFLLLMSMYHEIVSQSTYGWMNIDCGASTDYKDSEGIEWKTDGEYTKSGQSKTVANNGLVVSEQMDTLRFFSTLIKNCYSIPTPDKLKYLIRAGFFYGNYDGLGKPPIFDLVFDGNKWVTVNTSMETPVFYEMIYATSGDSIDICVARTQADQFPFISSLEAMPFGEKMYDKMNRNYAWFLSYRVHFGGSDVVRFPADEYNRIWNPISTPSLTSVTANFTDLTNNCPDDPPSSVILRGVRAEDSTSSILLPFDFPETSRVNYLALYFTEFDQLGADQNRSFSINIDGQDYGEPVTPQYEICEEFNVTTNASTGTMNITLSPVDGSTLPPLISSAEVFTVSQILVQGTNQDDIGGLQAITGRFSQLQVWTGDPCLPNNTVWEWVGCNSDEPPRVNSLYLSGYGLQGYIPDFSQMQALEIINMDHNQLIGDIPDFLGNLPNLKLLNLSYNNLNSDVPSSITNSRIIFDVRGNQPDPNNPDQQEAKKDPLEPLWSLISLVIIGFGIWWCFFRKRRSKTVFIQPPPPPPPQEGFVIEHVEQTTVVMRG